MQKTPFFRGYQKHPKNSPFFALFKKPYFWHFLIIFMNFFNFFDFFKFFLKFFVNFGQKVDFWGFFGGVKKRDFWPFFGLFWTPRFWILDFFWIFLVFVANFRKHRTFKMAYLYSGNRQKSAFWVFFLKFI